jgi:acyl-CoA thioesterase-2
MLQIASIDHAIWFHESFRADEYLLYEMTSPAAGHSRGLAFGKFFRQDGNIKINTNNLYLLIY